MKHTCIVGSVLQVGWGFTDHSWLAGNKSRFTIGPEQKREHLRAFLEQQVPPGRRVVLLGTSVGGAIAMDFAIAYPEVRQLKRLQV